LYRRGKAQPTMNDRRARAAVEAHKGPVGHHGARARRRRGNVRKKTGKINNSKEQYSICRGGDLHSLERYSDVVFSTTPPRQSTSAGRPSWDSSVPPTRIRPRAVRCDGEMPPPPPLPRERLRLLSSDSRLFLDEAVGSLSR
jgi:hypothetical protein